MPPDRVIERPWTGGAPTDPDLPTFASIRAAGHAAAAYSCGPAAGLPDDARLCGQITRPGRRDAIRAAVAEPPRGV